MAGQTSQSDTASARESLWPPERLDAMLDHLDANKGVDGLYMRDRSTAYDHALEHLAQMTHLKPISRRQIQNRFSSLWAKEKDSHYKNQPLGTLWLKGRQALNSECQKAALERRGREGWSGLRRRPSKRTSAFVLEGSLAPTSSPPKNNSRVRRNSTSSENSMLPALGKRGTLLKTAVHLCSM